MVRYDIFRVLPTELIPWASQSFVDKLWPGAIYQVRSLFVRVHEVSKPWQIDSSNFHITLKFDRHHSRNVSEWLDNSKHKSRHLARSYNYTSQQFLWWQSEARLSWTDNGMIFTRDWRHQLNICLLSYYACLSIQKGRRPGQIFSGPDSCPFMH